MDVGLARDERGVSEISRSDDFCLFGAFSLLDAIKFSLDLMGLGPGFGTFG